MCDRLILNARRLIALASLLLLGACTDKQLALERFLTDVKPGSIATLPDFGWPAGTLLCPMGHYQNQLHSSSAVAQRVNAVLQHSAAHGDEGLWTLVVIRPDTAGADGIGQLVFETKALGVATFASELERAEGGVPAGFTWQECVPAERAKVVALRVVRGRKMLAFGVQR